ncbi:MAG: hypothetical protein IJN07_05210 [Clostridia bacterium]|nr:hypothetical protein [Clostridia bacterium]
MKTCFFIGHRDAPPEIFPDLCEVIEQHILGYGVTEFVVGNYGAFDRMAARAVIAAKTRHPHISLLMLLPYHPAERPVKPPPGFDNTYYPLGMENVPRRLAIVCANRYMVNRADYLIAFVRYTASNARNLLEYAQSTKKAQQLHITNLAKG